MSLWGPARVHYKLVEWDPAARAVVAWESGPDRVAVLGEAGPAQLLPADNRVRL